MHTDTRTPLLRTRTLGWIAALACLGSGAWADGGSRFATQNAPFQAECGSCHVAYPPALLPQASWDRLLGHLPQHFGTDASLDAATLAQVRRFVQDNAGSYRRVREAPPQDRITRSEWFLREHREGEVPAEVWKRASVKSPANCAACHSGAAQGDYSEHSVRIPR